MADFVFPLQPPITHTSTRTEVATEKVPAGATGEREGEVPRVVLHGAEHQARGHGDPPALPQVRTLKQQEQESQGWFKRPSSAFGPTYFVPCKSIF